MGSPESLIEAPRSGKLHGDARLPLQRLLRMLNECNFSRRHSLENIACNASPNIRLAEGQLQRIAPSFFRELLLVHFLQAVDIRAVLREMKFECLHRDLPVRQFSDG